MAHLSSNALIQNRRVVQNPAGNRGVIDCQSTLRHHLFKVPVAQRVPQIPSHAQNDNVAPKMSPTEQCWLALAHSLHPTKPTLIRFATQPSNQEQTLRGSNAKHDAP